MTPSVQEKLNRFISNLTEDELARLSAARDKTTREDLPAALQEKFRQAAREFSPDDQAELRSLEHDAAALPVAGEAEDTAGYMINLPRQPQPDPLGRPVGGGGIVTGPANWLWNNYYSPIVQVFNNWQNDTLRGITGSL